MNNQQPVQGQPGQPGQQRKVMLFKPEQMRVLPEQFTAEEKQKWEQGLRALWTQINNNDPDSPQHTDAKRKLFEFSRTLSAKLQSAQAQRAQQSLGGGNGVQRPPSQGQQPQTQGGEGSMAGAQANRPKPQISPKLMEHVTKFPYQLPPHLTAGTPEAIAWITNSKNQYLKALISMENGASRVTQLEQALKSREESGNPFGEKEQKEFEEQKERAQNQHGVAKKFVDNFRQEQANIRLANQSASQQNNAQGGGGGGGGNAPAPQPRPQLNPQQQTPNPVSQTVNAAIEAARNQQMGAGRPNMPQSQLSQGQQNAPSQMGQPNVKLEQGQVPAPINTQISQMQQGRPFNNSPQSAVPRSAGGNPAPPSATASQPPNTIPQAFSLSEATTNAARTYSSSAVPVTNNNVMGHSHPSATTRETNPIQNNKMPIPKSLPETASRAPIPVAMPAQRPTYSGGPSNVGNGVLGQPAIAKAPGYNLDHEGDRVLSKKKLDELVRQVTGGGQGEGQALAPDVEESILQVADNFVDQVLEAACKNAKERGSRVLEIRDIQLTLERGYNIRIPGYSSDEIRTVRKIQPDPKWISKMSAVQAAKVTGGKNND